MTTKPLPLHPRLVNPIPDSDVGRTEAQIQATCIRLQIDGGGTIGVKKFQKTYDACLLIEQGASKAAAAKEIGVSRPTLDKMLEEGLDIEHQGRASTETWKQMKAEGITNPLDWNP